MPVSPRFGGDGTGAPLSPVGLEELSEVTQQYWKKLQDPRWQKRRLEVFSKAEFKCQECGSESKQLHAHHLRYVKGREPWEYEDFELRCLCDGCHEDRHFIDDNLRLICCRLSADQMFRLAGYAAGLVNPNAPIEGDTDVSKGIADGQRAAKEQQ